MQWDELKEKAKELGAEERDYLNNTKYLVFKDFYFTQDGNVYIGITDKDACRTEKVSTDRNYEQMLMIMEALK